MYCSSASAAVDCDDIPPKSLLLFEALINAVREAAPTAAIAFNTNPADTASAAGRWLEPG